MSVEITFIIVHCPHAPSQSPWLLGDSRQKYLEYLILTMLYTPCNVKMIISYVPNRKQHPHIWYILMIHNTNALVQWQWKLVSSVPFPRRKTKCGKLIWYYITPTYLNTIYKSPSSKVPQPSNPDILPYDKNNTQTPSKLTGTRGVYPFL